MSKITDIMTSEGTRPRGVIGLGSSPRGPSPSSKPKPEGAREARTVLREEVVCEKGEEEEEVEVGEVEEVEVGEKVEEGEVEEKGEEGEKLEE